MLLYLIRHGDSEGGHKPDAERLLTAEGQEAMARMADRVTDLAEAPTLLACSPLKRAIQTAEYFRDGWDTALHVVDWLFPEIPPTRIIEELTAREEQNIALVGHLPCLGLLLSALAWGLPPREVSLSKGSATCLELPQWEAGTAKIKWMLTPETIG